MIDVQVDADSPVAPYEQIRTRIAALAADGTLPAGTRLPPVRHLAAHLSLAVNTVARAYRELEQAGLVQTRGRSGTLVTARAAGVPAEAQLLARRYAQDTAALGVSPHTALDLARAALDLPAGSDPAPGSPAG